ncbi:hypothetical protein AMS68_006029 [Peltaster fructicola]|uniref:Mediator of RNA polymerase II transcription subunit 14 n=1 Tax=Peltaster fructicola TaxID=286661 RepID=A0A6H0Y0F7_9PEZI|nr:hypothetical protein AMS68_006029 [Peltaster fructicola]
MDQQPSAIALDTIKQEAGDSNAALSQPGPGADSANGSNGFATVKPEGAVVNGDFTKHTLPPLDDSWRASAANVSFGKMLERMGQGCYADLSELVTKLGDIPVSDVAAQVNGLRPATEDTDPASLKKKSLVMEFTSTWRERFIKARIISDWARTSGEDVAKFIDLRNTLRDREVRIQSAIQGIFNLKIEAINLRMPEPNIKGAMQYLSNGKSSYPDLGLLKPKPLEAKEVLELTNEMGVQANLRIWLNEPQLPYYMSEYTIANGRVTWRTPGEFEVDLACVDEDPAKSPWYFVDLRFLFCPTPVISDDARPHLEAQINAATAAKGLQGCYDFCHNYVLDYRIAEMESQAYALLRDRWFDALRIERLRRVLTVQYWTNRGGHKSWVELGVHSGKGQHGSHQPVTPVNFCRWFLDGKLAEYVNVGDDWTTLDLERLLIDVQRRHSAQDLKNLEQGLRARKISPEMLTIEFKEDLEDGGNSHLVLTLPSAHAACTRVITVGIAPMTGKWSLAPRTKEIRAFEQSILKDPTALTPTTLERLVCSVMQQGVEHEALKRGWTLTRRSFAEQQRAFKEYFDDAYEVSMWEPAVPQKTWPAGWAIAYSTSLQSARWWIVQLSADFVRATDEFFPQPKAWSRGLKDIEDIALSKFQRIVLSMQKSPKIRYREEKYKQVQFTEHGPCYFVNASDLLRTENTETPHWSLDPIKISGGKLLRQSWRFKHEMRIALRPGRLQHLRRYLSNLKIPGIMVSDNGGLVVEFQSELGESLWEAARVALRSLSTLNTCARLTNGPHLKCIIAGLDQIKIGYGSDLWVQIHFATELSTVVSRITLEPSTTNPHARIRVALEAMLNRNEQSVALTIRHLFATYKLLLAMSKLEAEEGVRPFVYVRDTTEYRIQYMGNPNIAFDISGHMLAQGDRLSLKWHLRRAATDGPAVEISEGFSKALQDFWTEPGLDCMSLKTALSTNDEGIATAIEKLHAIVRRFVVPTQPALVVDNTTNATQNGQQSDVIMLD